MVGPAIGEKHKSSVGYKLKSIHHKYYIYLGYSIAYNKCPKSKYSPSWEKRKRLPTIFAKYKLEAGTRARLGGGEKLESALFFFLLAEKTSPTTATNNAVVGNHDNQVYCKQTGTPKLSRRNVKLAFWELGERIDFVSPNIHEIYIIK